MFGNDLTIVVFTGKLKAPGPDHRKIVFSFFFSTINLMGTAYLKVTAMGRPSKWREINEKWSNGKISLL